MRGSHRRFTVVRSQYDLWGFAYTICISLLRLSYIPLKKDPKILVPYKKKDLFLAQAAALFHIILWPTLKEQSLFGKFWSHYRGSEEGVEPYDDLKSLIGCGRYLFLLTFYWFISQSRSPGHSRVQLGRNVYSFHREDSNGHAVGLGGVIHREQ